MSSQEDLRAIALAEFATVGYGGTSLQRIAELAGLAKSSVLYHFSSKEALLEAAVAPSIERIEGILARTETSAFSAENRAAFIAEFVDFLLAHRLEVHLFINQGRFLEDVPVIDRANAVVVRLASYFSSSSSTTEDTMRFGVALGGAAFTLVTQLSLPIEPPPIEETRAALITIVSELLAPVAVPAVTVTGG